MGRVRPALLITPIGFQSRPDPGRTREALSRMGMLGEPLGTQDGYRVGDRFLDHVTFLGCSPDIDLEPSNTHKAGEVDFIHISLRQLPGQAHYRLGFNPRPPLCPSCRQPAGDYTRLLAEVDKALEEAGYSCPACGQQISWLDMQWRDGAIVAQDVIEILGVHPREALPNDAFMAELNHRTQVEWRYLFL